MMRGDGPVRVGDGSVVPGLDDGLLRPAVSCSPYPMISASLGVIDNGAPTTVVVTVSTVLSRGGTDHADSLSGGRSSPTWTARARR